MAEQEQPSEGLREKKRQRTRRALTTAAFRLFEEKGYEQTTVAEIAAAAEVATKTFFNYFPSKEDVVFADARARLERALEEIGRRPDEEPAEAMRVTVERALLLLLSDDTDIEGSLLPLWLRLIATVPALQARGLHISFEMERRLTRALLAAYPGRFDVVTAAAVVGATLGAAQAGVGASLQRGDPFDQVREVLSHALDIALRGTRAAGAPPGA